MSGVSVEGDKREKKDECGQNLLYAFIKLSSGKLILKYRTFK